MDNSKQKEDTITKEIENRTSRIPSDIFLFAAIAAVGISFALKCMHKKDDAAYVGQWVAPILLLGLYNKLVKLSK